MPLKDIVDVVITRQTQTVSERGFGIPLILGTHKRFNESLKYYSDMTEVSTDFLPSDKEYIASQDIFSQQISPEKIAIGRRQVDDVTLEVLTPMAGKNYTISINGNDVTTTASPIAQFSIVDLSEDLVNGNKIKVVLNNENVGLIKSIIEFDADFGVGSVIQGTINGVPLTPVPYDTSQADTMNDLRTELLLNSSISGGGQVIILDDNSLEVTFNAKGNNTINSFVVTGGNAPTGIITEWGFEYNLSSQNTMQEIADDIDLQFAGFTSEIQGIDSLRLVTSGPIGVPAIIQHFLINDGITQPVALISTPLQVIAAQDVVALIVSNLNSNPPSIDYPIIAVDNLDGTFTLQSQLPGTAYTLEYSTDIINPNIARVDITQIFPNREYHVTINGIKFSYLTSNSVQSADEIIQGLISEISNSGISVDAYQNTEGELEIASTDLAFSFSLSVSEGIMVIQKGITEISLVPSRSVIIDLNEIENYDSDWYALISTSRDPSVVSQIAQWTESKIKIFGTSSSDQNIINLPAGVDTSSIASLFLSLGYVRTFVMYHQDSESDFPEAAWFGRVLPLVPGSETWKFKTLNSISYTLLTTTQSKNALDKNANIYEFIAGVGITQNGTMAQGEFIDIVRGIDWLTSRIQEFVYSVLVKNDKVPYTDAGIAVIQAEVMRALSLGVFNDFLSDDPAPKVTVPRASTVPPTDKANRILRNVKFEATLTGAIHAVKITGNISI